MIDTEVLVPEGWLLVPTAPGTERLRARLVQAVVQRYVPESLPRDRAEPWRRQLRKQLQASVDEAAAARARSVLLPLAEYGGQRLPGSLLTAVLEDDPQVEAQLLIDGVLADAGEDGVLLDVGGGIAARVQDVVDGSASGRPHPARRVTYYVSHPDRAGVWGLLTFTVLTDGDLEHPGVQAVTAMFDAVVGTLQWVDREDDLPADELLAQVEALEPTAP